MGDVLRWLARLEAEGTVDEIADVLAGCDADGADVALDVLLGLQDPDSRYRPARAGQAPPAPAATLAPVTAEELG